MRPIQRAANIPKREDSRYSYGYFAAIIMQGFKYSFGKKIGSKYPLDRAAFKECSRIDGKVTSVEGDIY